MKIVRSVTVAVVMLAAGVPALAATHSFTLNNFTSQVVTRVSVKGGKVVGFRQVLPQSSFTFQVEFPDGQCISKGVRVKFSKGAPSDTRNYNVCKDGGLTVVGR